MSSNFPIRPGQGNQNIQGIQNAPDKSTIPDQKALRQAQYDQDQFMPPADLEPASQGGQGTQNPLLSLSVSDALEFLQSVPQNKQIEILGNKIPVQSLEQMLAQVMQAGGGDATVADILEQIGQQASSAAPNVPIQNASVAQAILGLKDLPPNQVVLNTNAPGGGTQAINAGTLLSILTQVSQSLGSKADNMTVVQALQFVAQASAQKAPPTS